MPECVGLEEIVRSGDHCSQKLEACPHDTDSLSTLGNHDFDDLWEFDHHGPHGDAISQAGAEECSQTWT